MFHDFRFLISEINKNIVDFKSAKKELIPSERPAFRCRGN